MQVGNLNAKLLINSQVYEECSEGFINKNIVVINVDGGAIYNLWLNV